MINSAMPGLAPTFLVMMASAMVLAIPAAADETGAAALFQRCAACHLPDGAGVPGAYPPLAGRLGKLAATPAGRTYLIMVVERGLVGSIKASGQIYRNVMPAQSGALDATQIAAVLNYLLATLNAATVPESWPRISPKEVERTRASHHKADAGAVLRMRADAFAATEAGQ